ncbi:MAG: hypothetical protein QOJ99_2123 [Bryobacterales bacterium]|nr:hypothetical protein [Bryobacterales bacterium]
MLRPFRFFRLDATDRRFFTAAFISMLAVRAALLFWPVQRVILSTDSVRLPWLDRNAGKLGQRRVAKRIRQAAVLCGGSSTCLSEAIAARFLLARAGFTSELRIGVKKTGGRFEAHAWLECPDNIVIGNPSPEGKQYSRLPSFGRFCA